MTSIPGTDVIPLTLEEFLASLEDDAPRRHMGPGPHKSGSPQSIHGSGGPNPGAAWKIGKQGGDSVHPTTGRRPATGYMVAQPQGARIVPAEAWFDHGEREMDQFIRDREADFKADPDAFVGIWFDKKHAEFALDVSHNVQDVDEAKRLGASWDQQSIWDVVNQREIPTGGTGGRDGGYADQRSAAAGLLDDVRGGAAGLVPPDRGGDPGARRALRVADPEVVDALEEFHRRHLPGQHDQQKHAGGRIGVHTGLRDDLKNPEKGNAKLIPEATSMAALPDDLQTEMRAGLGRLGKTEADLDAGVEGCFARAVQASGGTIDTRAGKFTGDPDGIEWYEEAHRGAVEITDIDRSLTVDQGSGMIAACSPQQPWSENLAAAKYTASMLRDNPVVPVDLLEGVVITKEIPGMGKVTGTALDFAMLESAGRKFDGKRSTPPSRSALRDAHLADLDPYTAAAVIKAMGQAGYGTPDGLKLSAIDDVTGERVPVKWTCGVAHLGRAVRIGRGESPDAVLKGHKVRSFHNNIRDPRNPFDDVTVDVHAFSVAMDEKYASASDEYKYFAGGSNKKTERGRQLGTPPVNATVGVQGLYPVFAEAYRRIGAKYGLSAKQVQAITWVQWRKEHPTDQRRKQGVK